MALARERLGLARTALVVFVLAWILGPDELRSAVPIWIVFLIALGLEVNFLVGAVRAPRARSVERGPQGVDRERFGYEEDASDLLLVRDGDEELWIPYSGETDEELDDLIAEVREQPVCEGRAPRLRLDPIAATLPSLDSSSLMHQRSVDKDSRRGAVLDA